MKESVQGGTAIRPTSAANVSITGFRFTYFKSERESFQVLGF